ncbi:MAG: FecR domain-containing protein [Proteobacteria bacterium]|nr:FecR domain-containing protein [Pseudomonadota bacterium]
MTRATDRTREAITDSAAEWLVALRDEELGEADHAAFLAWLRASPRHVEEYLRLRALDRRVAIAALALPVSATADLDADPGHEFAGTTVLHPRQSPEVTPSHPQRRRHFVAAAAVLGSVLIAVALWLNVGPGGSLPAQTYRTAHGEQRTVPLPDGSVLHVNTDSVATVRYSSDERLVSIERGEAFFEVAPRSAARFRVVAGDLSAVAVGTKFDLRRQEAATTVTVVEGHVAVLAGIASPAAVTAALHIGSGEQVRVVNGTVPVSAAAVDVRRSVGWLKRQIAFEQQTLADVAAEFNRYLQVPLIVEGNRLQQLRISGVFDPYNIDAFASFLDTLEGVAVERTPAMIRVYERTPKSRAP